MNLSALVHIPHGLIRRHLPRVERGLTAAGLAGLVYLLVSSLPAYPPFWDGVIVAVVFLTTFTSPFVGFSLAALAAFYPISTLSIYLAVIFIAIAILAMRPISQNLGATVLVMSAPLLGGYSLGWVIPLLGGLWWGAAGGSWVGALAALWGMVAAGMAGLNPDWLMSFGHFPSSTAIVERFANTNSLDTLGLLVFPLASDTTVLLYHLLQIALWGVVGTFVGSLNDRPTVQNRRPWGGALITIAGGFTLLGIHLILAFWLRQPVVSAPEYAMWVLAAATAGIIAAALEMLQDFFEHPLPRLGWKKPRTGGAAASEQVSGPQPVPPPASYPPLEKEKDKNVQDLILLELDED